MRLILVRHGESEANVSGELDTAAPGRRLTDRGRTQAITAGRALQDYGAESIFASPLPRAQQTAEALAGSWGLPVETLYGVEEIEAGAHEGSHDPQALTDYLDVVRAWTYGDLDRKIPAGGDGKAFVSRYDAAIGKVLASRVGRAVVVSHGSAIRVWVASQLDQDSVETIATSRLLNTGFVELELEGSNWTLVTWHSEPAGGSLAVVDTSVDPTSAIGLDATSAR